MKYLFSGFVFVAAAFAACQNAEEPLPAYLHIEPFVVQAPGGEGYQEITEGWVYLGPAFSGAYTLPATVPLLGSGASQIRVYPGVKENGLSGTPNIYPFLSYYETTANLDPPGETAIQPVAQYVNDAQYAWALPYTTFEPDAPGDIPLENRDDDAATGYELTADDSQGLPARFGRSVRFAVDTLHPAMEVATEAKPLPSSGEAQVWLEIHHRNDIPFQLWLIGQNPGEPEAYQPVYEFVEQADWNKVYFNLTPFLQESLKQTYRLYFRVFLPTNNQNKYEPQQGEVFVDNLRLLHF